MPEITPFNFEDVVVRTMILEDEPWFVAKDVCDVLGIANPTQAVQQLDYDELAMQNIGYSGPGNPNVNIISESGLYTLIIRSNKPQAKPFRRWVTHEVLPAIRKTGSYSLADRQRNLLESEIKEGAQLLAQVISKPSLDESERWQLIDRLFRELFGQGVEMLAGKPAPAPSLPSWGHDLPLMELRLEDEQRLAYVTYNTIYIFISAKCRKSEKSACSLDLLYSVFAQWWLEHAGFSAPPIEVFSRSLGFRRLHLLGDPWVIGIEPDKDRQQRKQLT